MPQCTVPRAYMLYVVPVTEEQEHNLPAIANLDGTGRLQAVFREQSPRSYPLIECFGRATSIPVLLYTTFNLKGEPIVNTPANSFNTFSKSDMDALVLENFLIEKAV